MLRFKSKILLVVFALSLIASPIISEASLSDLEWRINVGDRLNYTYLGISTHDTTVTVEEEIYFIIDDLIGVPIPTAAGSSVTAYWLNGSLVNTEGEDHPSFYCENLVLIDSIAIRVGNWSLYEEIVEDYWSVVTIPPSYYVVTFDESSETWNATVTVYWPEGLVNRRTAYSYSKSTGILLHCYYIRYTGGNVTEFDYLSLARLLSQSGGEDAVLIGYAVIVGVLVIVIVSKKRK